MCGIRLNASCQKSFYMRGRSAMETLEKMDLNLALGDVSLLGLLRTFDLRLHFLARWEGVATTPVSVHGMLKQRWLQCQAGSIHVKVEEALLEKGITEFNEFRASSDESILAACKSRLPLKEPLNYADLQDIEQAPGRVMAATEAAEFEEAKTAWISLSGNVMSMATSVGKVASDVIDHVNTKAREAKREAARRSTAEKQAALRKVRDDAKAAAAKIREKIEKPAESMPAVLLADYSPVPEVAVLANLEAVKTADWNKPWVLPKCDDVQLCLGESPVQKSMTTFAAQCTKITDQAGRHQYCYQEGAVKDRVDKLLQDFMPPSEKLFDMTNVVEGGDKFMQCTWLYAFSASMQFVGLPPNGAAQVRVHATGKVESLIIDLKSFVKCHMDANNGAELNLTMLNSQLSECQTEGISKYLASGVQMWRHTLQTGETLYLPTGVAIVEKCSPSQSFIYGMRKSFLVRSSECYEAYKTVLDLFKAEKRNTEKMEAIAKALQPGLQAGQPVHQDASVKAAAAAAASVAIGSEAAASDPKQHSPSKS